METRERSTAPVLAALEEARERTLTLVASVSDEDLERVHSTLMSPLVWDLGHIAAFEDLWIVHRYGERPLLHEELADVYDAFETPRAGRGDLPFLAPDEAREYLAEVHERAIDVIDDRGVGDGIVAELTLRHEHQHNETMLQTLQLAQLDGLRPASPRHGDRDQPIRRSPGSSWWRSRVGRARSARRAAGFAYDNERLRHRTDVRDYLIGRTPITNATYLTFVEGGGYERREWWSDEGWSWKEDYDITRPQSWTADLRSEWRLLRARATAPEPTGGPRLLVRGRRLRPCARCSPPH